MLSLWHSREDSTTERLPFLRTEATEEWSEFGTIRQIMCSVHGRTKRVDHARDIGNQNIVSAFQIWD